jgi:adenine-specific DNA methylase
MGQYPKRLIEVDLPIKEISAHARREKSIRHGHISTLHIWWARRPLAACRAVICAALWPDPADELCPPAFRKAAARLLCEFAEKARSNRTVMELCQSHWPRWSRTTREMLDPTDPARWPEIRQGLLDFIADFANWDASTLSAFLETARALTQAAHEALGGAPGTKPLVVDPFAGGGSIPLEALRVGADAFASDLNPVAVLLNKVVLEYIPKYGQRLANEVRRWGTWIKQEAEKELAEFYPKDPDGATPIAYLWARTIQCEGPGCGAEVPLIRSLWLAKRANRSVALQLVPRPRAKRVDFKIIVKQRGGWVNQDDPKEKIADPKFDGTVKRGSATCPCCGYTTPISRLREQLNRRRGGTYDPRIFCVVTTRDDEQGRFYRLPTDKDLAVTVRAAKELSRMKKVHSEPVSLVPDESTECYHVFVNRGPTYGISTWADFYTARQQVMLAALTGLIRRLRREVAAKDRDDFVRALQTVLACAVDREAEHSTSLCRWNSTGQKMQATFGRQAIPMMWDFCETNPFGGSVGSWESIMECVLIPFASAGALTCTGHVEQASATAHPLPNDSAAAVITDPPYYYSVQYADLADFFYVWLRRMLLSSYPSLLAEPLIKKDEEIIVQSPGHEFAAEGKNNAFYERMMRSAMTDARRLLESSGIGVIVFAHKSTSGWELQLQSMINAGWVVTASWPIDTEMGSRLLAQDKAALGSSVHLVCRPREKPNGTLRADEIGDWREVLAELPRRIHEWMPRLANEGVVGADAIFASLGPALEVFSRWSRVEKASGEAVTLREYLEHVWAAVAKEALTMIFEGADATGFEEDARLTAMWLWTLKTGEGNGKGPAKEEETENDEEEGTAGRGKVSGFALEYDAARKIAQGLGVHLDALASVVEVKGETARLLAVAERTRYLFGKDEAEAPGAKRRKKEAQLKLGFVADLEKAEEAGGWGQKEAPRQGETVLDRVHQAMILFAAGRGEALRRFLVEEGVGRDDRFWRLAQALAALYPPSTDERRWVEGVMARKKGLGF